jgi:hypothetical protein
MENTKNSKLKPLNLAKLRRDMEMIMSEIDRTGGVLPDAYSPVMWQRLQHTTEKVANAISGCEDDAEWHDHRTGGNQIGTRYTAGSRVCCLEYDAATGLGRTPLHHRRNAMSEVWGKGR